MPIHSTGRLEIVQSNAIGDRRPERADTCLRSHSKPCPALPTQCLLPTPNAPGWGSFIFNLVSAHTGFL